MADVTQILDRIESGDEIASSELLPLVYGELRKLAAARMASERPDHTLQSTALVHEAYLRLVDTEKVQHWNSRGHFFAAAAEAMRRILVEQARHRESQRAGGKHERVELDQLEPEVNPPSLELIALNEALLKLEQHNPRMAELVKLRYFAGLTVREAAQNMNIATSTAVADWAYAKGWLHLQLAGQEN